MVSPDGSQEEVSQGRQTVGVPALPPALPSFRPRKTAALAVSGLLLLSGALSGALAGFKVTPIPATPAAPATTAPASLPELAPVGTAVPELQPLAPAPSTSPNPAPAPALNPPVSTASLPGSPSDPLYTAQWDMDAVRMPQAWNLLSTRKLQPAPVTVAVIDTGYVPTPELGARLVNGYDFVSNPARAGDGNGRDGDATGLGPNAYHGEVVANLIGAAHDGRGMAGVNPQAKIVAVRVAGIAGDVDPVDLADAIRWAVGLPVAGAPANPNPAKILNLSLFADFIPLTGCDARIQKAVDDATAKGALLVVGAGNDNADVQGYSPAGCRNVLTVTSVDSAGKRPGYANWGANVGLAAHGGSPAQRLTLSTTLHPSGSMTPDAGTSLATPHVAGVASLLLGLRPRLTPAQVKSVLLLSAAPFPAGGCDPEPRKRCGQGVLNAEAALQRALASTLGK